MIRHDFMRHFQESFLKMPRITQTKVGTVFLKEVAPRKWRVSWVDPLTKKHIRRVLPAASFKDAQAQAHEINSQLAAGRGFGGRLRGSVGHPVSDAILEAVRHSDANERTRKDYLSRSNAFIEYLNKNAQGIRAWSEVTEEILANFVNHCRQQGVSHDTIRLRLYVLRLTSNFMSQTYPQQYRNVTNHLKLKRHDPPKSDLEHKDSILSESQLRPLLAWLKEHAPMVHVWAMLQGLCGLRMLEAAYLREQDFDHEKRTVIITETSAHKPKNRPSYRTIPIPQIVAVTLSEWIAQLKVRHLEGYLFAPSRARNGRRGAKTKEARVGAFTRESVGNLWADTLETAKTQKLDVPPLFVPRKLRATFVTAMREAGADFAVLQAYIGHAPTSVLSLHYDKVDLTRLAAIASLAQAMYDGKSETQLQPQTEAKIEAVMQ